MTVDINYWYRDEDVQQAIEAYVLDGKVLQRAKKREFLLEYTEDNVPKSGGDVIIALTPCASSNEPFYFFDKSELPKGDGDDQRTDVFDEILPLLTRSGAKARIVFPLNVGGAHWVTAQVDITATISGQAATYTVAVSGYDPFGGDGSLKASFYPKIEATIKKRLSRADPSPTVNVSYHKTNDTRRQAKGDGTSCGVITARDIYLKLQGLGLALTKTESNTTYFPVGAKELRELQLAQVKESLPSIAEQFEFRVSGEYDKALRSVPQIIEDQGDMSVFIPEVDNNIATSVAVLVTSIENAELRSAVGEAMQNAELYSHNQAKYLAAIEDSINLVPALIMSNDVELSDTDLSRIFQLQQLLFSDASTLNPADVAMTLQEVASLLDLCRNFTLTENLTTDKGRDQLNQILLRIMLNVEGLRGSHAQVTIQAEASVERAEAVEMDGAYPLRSGNYMKFYNDASEDITGSVGAFHDLAWAIDQAEQFIFMVDWSFHPATYLTRNGEDLLSQQVGDKLARKAGEGVLVAINTWQHPVNGAPDKVNNAGGEWLADRIKNLALAPPKNWDAKTASDNLLWRASLFGAQNWSETRGPADWTHSHHQKFVVLDVPGKSGTRALGVFYGGLDVTKGRFDWPGHPFAFFEDTDNPSDDYKTFTGKYDDYYNGEFGDKETLLREPWHDVHAQLCGPSAIDFVKEFAGRWAHRQKNYASWSDLGDNDDTAINKVFDKAEWIHSALINNSPDVGTKPEMPSGNESFKVCTTRSLSKINWLGNTAKAHAFYESLAWKNPEKKFEASILQTYLDTIRLAEDFIYIETQYLIGSGKYWNAKQTAIVNELPKALVDKIITQSAREKEFHVYVVLPMFPEGTPQSESMQGVRYMQWETIKYMLRALDDAGVEWQNYLSFYCLGRCDGVTSDVATTIHNSRQDNVMDHQRYMIYVHSKFMVVDDRYMIVGSANLNDRSLAGDGDTEIATLVAPEDKVMQGSGYSQQIREFRMKLWAEHLGSGVDPKTYTFPGQKQTFELVQGEGDKNLESFLGGKKRNHLLRFPIDLTAKSLYEKISYLTLNQKSNEIRFGAMTYIPDAPKSSDWGRWKGSVSSSWLMKPTSLMKATGTTRNILK